VKAGRHFQSGFLFGGTELRVLHILKTNFGAPWAYRQIRHLKLMGVDVCVMLPDGVSGFALEYAKLGVQVVPFDAALPLRTPGRMIKMVAHFRQIIRELAPDLVHCHFVTNIMFARIAMRGMKIPRLFQVPGPLHLENWMYRRAEIILADTADHWAGSCQKTCNIYRASGIPSEKIHFGWYAGDFGEYAKSYTRTGKLRRELGIAEETILIGTVSYLYKPKYHMLQFKGIKGHEDFIDAFAMIIRRVSNVHAVIIGGPADNAMGYMNHIQRLANKRCGKSITFTGFRQDIFEIYKDLDIAVHPSRSENFGGSGESLSLAIPTLTTDVGGFPDIIQDGKTGYMSKVARPDLLAEKLRYMIDNYEEAKAVAKCGQELIVKINSQLSAQQALDMYSKMLHAGR